MHRTASRRRDGERGQVIVLFTLMFIAATAMVGLVLDGGGAFAMRRDAQAAADMGAIAGANDYLANSNSASAIATAKTIVTANGFTDGVGGETVTVTLTASPTLALKVDIGADHQNAFARVIPGQESWRVSVTATASAGVPDTAQGAAPMIFNYRVFGTDGMPQSRFTKDGCAVAAGRDVLGGCQFGGVNDPIPTFEEAIAWTTYGNPTNANTNQIRDYIRAVPGSPNADPITVDLNDPIDQANSGMHADAYDEVNNYLAGNSFPVPVVDDNGRFVGWATFYITSADRPTKKLYGYFMSPVKNSSLTIANCAGSGCPNYLGSYVLKLTN